MKILTDPNSVCRPGQAFLAMAMLLAWTPATRGENVTLVTLETGGPVLSSWGFPTAYETPDTYHFKIGFETTEVAAPGFFADSLTISLYNQDSPDPGKVMALVTLDVFGLTVAPSNPGGIFLDSAAVAYTAVPPFVPATLPAPQAFDVVVTLPKELAGQLTWVQLDFFDNQNGQASRGHAAIPHPIPDPIPEPSVVALLGAGIAATAGLALRRGERR